MSRFEDNNIVERITKLEALVGQHPKLVKAPASDTEGGFEYITAEEASKRLFAQRDSLMGQFANKRRAERVLEALEAIVAQYGTSYGYFYFAGPLWDEAWEAIEQYKNPGAKRTAEISAASNEREYDHSDPWDWQ